MSEDKKRIRVLKVVKKPAYVEKPLDDSPPARERAIMLEDMYLQSRDETAGLLKSQPNFGRSLKYQQLYIRAREIGILAYSSMMKPPPKVPWGLVGLLIIGVAVIGMFTFNPEYGRGLAVFLSSQQNQLFLIVFFLVVLGITWIVLRRRSRRGAL